jgi:hypothetical protein
VAVFLQPGDDVVLELIAGMVGTDVDAHPPSFAGICGRLDPDPD